MTEHYDETLCNHYHSVPSGFCSCNSDCGCWIGCCKNNYPILKIPVHNRDNSIMERQFDDFGNCIRCGSQVGSLQVHDIEQCNQIKRAKQMRKIISDPFDNIFDDFAKIGAEAFNNMQKSPTPSDEDLAKMFFSLVMSSGIPLIGIPVAYEEVEDFDNLTLKQLRSIVDFVKEMRK